MFLNSCSFYPLVVSRVFLMKKFQVKSFLEKFVKSHADEIPKIKLQAKFYPYVHQLAESLHVRYVSCDKLEFLPVFCHFTDPTFLGFGLVLLGQITLRIVGYHFFSQLTTTLNICLNKFEIIRTKIEGVCQSGRKAVTHNSKSDLPSITT